jgi:hypothetical protein
MAILVTRLRDELLISAERAGGGAIFEIVNRIDRSYFHPAWRAMSWAAAVHHAGTDDE